MQTPPCRKGRCVGQLAHCVALPPEQVAHVPSHGSQVPALAYIPAGHVCTHCEPSLKGLDAPHVVQSDEVPPEHVWHEPSHVAHLRGR